MLIETIATLSGIGAFGAIGELVRRSIAEGRWRRGIEKDIEALQADQRRVNDRISKAQDETAAHFEKVESAIADLAKDVSEVKLAVARIEAALKASSK